MRRLAGLWLLLGLSLVSGVYAQTATSDAFAQAERAYAAGDYNAAVALYEQAMAQGARHPALYFNLATVYEAQGQTGAALLYYLRAHQGVPRDADLNGRITQLQAERLDVQQDETIIIDRLGTVVSGIATVGELAGLAFGLWLIWFGLATLVVAQPLWREGVRPVLVVLGVVLLSALVLLGTRLYVENYRPQGVVTVAEVDVYSGPSLDYLQLFTLSEAAELRRVDEEAGWSRIVVPNGRRGWVEADQIGLVTSRVP